MSLVDLEVWQILITSALKEEAGRWRNKGQQRLKLRLFHIHKVRV